MQKRPVPESSGASLAKRPHLESVIEIHPGGKKSAGCSAFASSADCRNKGNNDLQDAYLYIPIVEHQCCFLQFVWHNTPYQWKVLPFCWPQPLEFLLNLHILGSQGITFPSTKQTVPKLSVWY